MRCALSGCVRPGLTAIILCALAGSAGHSYAAETQAWDAASSLAASASPPGLRLVWNSGSEDPAAALDRLERAGFPVAVALPPHVYYVRAEGASRSLLPIGFSFQEDGRAESAARQVAVGPPDAPEPRVGAAVGVDLDPFQGRNDAFPPIRLGSSPLRNRIARGGMLQGLPFGARWFDTSEFMIGRVAVSILFPESDGTTDPNRYNWTPALRDSVIRSAVRGLAKWNGFAASHGIALSFAIEVHAGLATRYEPIDRTVAEEDNWIEDVLAGYAGYRSDASTLEYDVANAARSRLGAQWSVLLFAVQNDTDPDGAFPDGYFSHARLGGPFFVTPVNNMNSTSATLDFYIEHEIAHSFWALDEHFPSNGWWSCQLTTGYFNQPNSNSVVPAPGYCGYRRGCLMYANYPDSLCDFTQRQIGWADLDGNGIPDLIETHPAVFPDSSEYRTVAGSPITLRGKALEVAIPNQNPYHYFLGDSISIASIDSVRYRVDGGPANRAVPSDGTFDSGREWFTATLPVLPPGDYVVEWEAWNSNGLKNAESQFTTVSLRAPSAPAGAGGGAWGSVGVARALAPGRPDTEPRAGTVHVAGASG
ncbi:MAG: hypothetical protein E6K74_11690 [Candidatus Eisenbacteria bacterium]|uniref:Peptidase M6-like domain-containing protein n=1 Tax=Eiseniibacteriota bacterium TaxID=2212470 RepID=A0A538SMR0_UNCEI|nr:MAG: hypothetical protein E6K74_11690 [Candidatus Eisenbacteria bacterium]